MVKCEEIVRTFCSDKLKLAGNATNSAYCGEVCIISKQGSKFEDQCRTGEQFLREVQERRKNLIPVIKRLRDAGLCKSVDMNYNMISFIFWSEMLLRGKCVVK